MALKKLAAALLLLMTGCAGGSPRRTGADEPPGQSPAESLRVSPSMALRLPAGGGAVRAYPLPQLGLVAWVSGGVVSPVRAAIAMDAPGNRLLYRDRAGAVVAFDLVGSHEQAITPRGRWFTAIATDTLLAVSNQGDVIESEPWGSHPWPSALGGGVIDAFAALGSRLLLVRRDSVALATREAGTALAVPAPATPIHAVSRNGDALAFGTDSGVVVLEDRDQWRSWFLRLVGSPTDVAFSPSGHEIFVALQAKSELGVVDRFTHRERPAIPLPGPAAELRMDPWGRAVLVRPLEPSRRGETWVVGLASGRLLGRLYTTWASDLPTVSPDGTLLYRDGTAVVARDIRSLDSLGAVAGGAADVWFVSRWRPTAGVAAAQEAARRTDSAARASGAERPRAPREPGLAAAGIAAAPRVARPLAPGATPVPTPPVRPPTPAAGTATPANRSVVPAARAPAAPPAPHGATSWIQLGVFQIESRARGFADELARDGHAALVVPPATDGAGWRVLVGPFPSRPAADSAARLLGRPYFITGRGPGGAANE